MSNHTKLPANISCLFILFLFFTISMSSAQENSSKENWRELFNGKDINDWFVKIHHHEVGVNYGNTFSIEDEMIRASYENYGGTFDDQFGHLYYKQSYSYFRLQLEYRFVGELYPGAPSYTIMNSGVMFHSQDPRTMPKEQNWPISVEMQFLGGLKEGKPRPTGNMCSPGTEVIYDGKMYPGHCINSTSETYFGDQWVLAELIVYGDSLVIHKINGATVLQYTQPQIGGGVVERFDPSLKQDGKLLTEGFIALQSEGQPVDFKNIRLLNLAGCMDPKALNYKDYYVKSNPNDCEYSR